MQWPDAKSDPLLVVSCLGEQLQREKCFVVAQIAYALLRIENKNIAKFTFENATQRWQSQKFLHK